MTSIEKSMITALKTREDVSNYNTHKERIHNMVKFLSEEYNTCSDTDIINSMEKHYYDYLGMSSKKLWGMIDSVVQETFMKRDLQIILNQIRDRVIVTGSYAFGNQTDASDIDMFIKEIPEDKREFDDCYNVVAEDYCKELIQYFESLGYEWSSCFPSSFAIDDTVIPLEFSAYYDIDMDNVFEIEILGVKMQAAKSTHTSDKYLNGQKRRI